MDKKYKKMIKVMLQKEELSEKRRAKRRRSSKDNTKIEEPWFLYILKCNDGSLYTGITKNLERRLKMHNDGKASRYTRTRRPVELVYHENCVSRAQALVRECKIKGFPKEKKEKLIKGI